MVVLKMMIIPRECGRFSLWSAMPFSVSLSKVAGSTINLQFPLVQQFPLKASRNFLPPICCAPLQQQVDSGIMCEPCSGRGWLICDFCKGQKTNVKSETNRIYRRCPSCRAVGYVLCSKCKVFKCVTFPDYNDGMKLIF